MDMEVTPRNPLGDQAFLRPHHDHGGRPGAEVLREEGGTGRARDHPGAEPQLQSGLAAPEKTGAGRKMVAMA